MIEAISRKYLMKLVKQIDLAIWREYSSYKDVKFYVEKWHEFDENWNNGWENFPIRTKPNGEIDLLATLHGIDAKTLLQMAVDLGLETPDFIHVSQHFEMM